MKEQLRQFLVESSTHGYAGGDDRGRVKEEDGSEIITYASGDFRMHDNFFGGNPYGGREVIFFRDKPVWIMVYYGFVSEGVDQKAVYSFLQQALREMPEDAPFRGPRVYEKDNWKYENAWEGEIESFSGDEYIYRDGKKVYGAGYRGGLVDQ